jgi:hypothetical protein
VTGTDHRIRVTATHPHREADMRLGRRLTTGIAEDPPAPTPAPPAVADDEAPQTVAEAPVTPELVGDPAVSGG